MKNNNELLEKAITEVQAFLRMSRVTKQIFNESKEVVKEMQAQIQSSKFEIIWCKYCIEGELELQKEMVESHLNMDLV